MIRWGNRQRKLEKAGIIKKGQYDNLSPYAKRQISKLWKEYGEVAEFPANFIKRRVGKQTAKDLRASGYNVKKNQVAYIPRVGAKDVRIDGKRGRISHVYNDKKTIYPISPTGRGLSHIENHADEIRKELAAAEAMGLNVQLSARFGSNGIFGEKTVTFQDLDALLMYMQNFMPKDASNLTPREQEEQRNELFSQIGIVIIYDE